MALIGAIAERIGAATGVPFAARGADRVGGGCINEALTLHDGARRFFVKINEAARRPMFEAEAEGLREILNTGTIRAPRPICLGVDDGRAWLALEHLDLGGRGQGARMGEQLAAMHRRTAPSLGSAASFGWHRDNTIGATPQINTPCGDWVAFLRERRLRYQLDLAATNGASRQVTERGTLLLERLHSFFTDYRPEASLLHGDLWGGNAAFTQAGEPAIFDPAVYYGDREADIAMTELFGGFDADFYAAYRAAWPLDAGYATRRTLYNLYHVLNHFNLFGGGYLAQARGMIDGLLAECS
jgi:fructosamine-3-kinase